MSAHKDKFDDLLMRQVSERVANLPPGSDSSKVRAGQVGDSKVLPPEIQAAMQEKWDAQIMSRFGFDDYAAMEAELRCSL